MGEQWGMPMVWIEKFLEKAKGKGWVLGCKVPHALGARYLVWDSFLSNTCIPGG